MGGINLNLDLTQQPKVVLQVKMMGVYAAGTDYSVGDAVTYNGGTYYMHTDAAAGTLPTDTTKWQAINSPNDYVESLTSFTLTNATSDNTISVDQNGNVGTNVATDGALHIENTGNTGIGLGVYTNIGATAEAPLVKIHAENTAFDQSVVSISGKNDLSTSVSTLWVQYTGADASGWAVVRIKNDAIAGASDALRVDIAAGNSGNGITVNVDGVGKGIEVDHDDTGTNASIVIDRDGNNAAYIFGMKITVDNVGVGGLVCGIDFSDMTDTEPLFKFPSATPDADLSAKAPQTDAAAGFIPVLYGTTVYAIPVYALS